MFCILGLSGEAHIPNEIEMGLPVGCTESLTLMSPFIPHLFTPPPLGLFTPHPSPLQTFSPTLVSYHLSLPTLGIFTSV